MHEEQMKLYNSFPVRQSKRKLNIHEVVMVFFLFFFFDRAS